MKNKIILNLYGVFLTIIFISILAIISRQDIKTSFIVENDSYGFNYAKDNNIDIISLSDSNKDDYVINIETFKYEKIDGGLKIIGYDGISEEIVIPESIDKDQVIAIGSFEHNFKKIIISSNIETIDLNLTNVTLMCYQNELCENDNLTTEIIPESSVEKYNFNEEKINFEYNIKDNKIEITKFNGGIIPTTLNGYEVTKLSFKYDGEIIYIPSSVNEIDIDFKNGYDNNFYMSILFSLLSLVVYIIVLSKFASKKDNEFNNQPTYILSTIYLIGLLIYSFLSGYYKYDNKLLIIIYISTTLIYIFIMIILNMAKIIKRNTICRENKN